MLNFIGKIFSKHDASASSMQRVKSDHWYEEKYDKLIVQRNFLVVFLIILLVFAIATVVAISVVINSKQFDPFVVQVDQNTGVAKIVNPAGSTVIQGNEAMAKYFIKKYVTARETFNIVDFASNARNIVRIFSNNQVYKNYIGYIKNPKNDPNLIYGEKNTTYLTLKSWSKLAEKKYIMRFAINETTGAKKIMNKIAVVEFDYVAMQLTQSQRDINPIGFQVIAYRVDDDNS